MLHGSSLVPKLLLLSGCEKYSLGTRLMWQYLEFNVEYIIKVFNTCNTKLI